MRIEHLERENATLIEERDHWKRRSEHLEKELEAARRAGRRQAAPFAKDRRQGTGRRPGRRAGAEYGKQECRRPPARVDETHAAPAPKTCPDCGGHVAVERVAAQYQEDVPDVRPLVRRFDVEVGRGAQCRRRVQGRHPLQTSDALGAAGVQWGPNVAALTAELHTESGLPLEKTARVLRTRFGLHVTKGGLVRLLHRTADAAAPAYAALCEQVRRSPVVTPDETGWRVDATRHWLWAFATPETTVYAICAGRGFADAAAVLGADFAGVLVRDGWAAYRGFEHAPHQTCLAHLLRRCKDLRTDHPDSPWAAAVQTVLQDALALRTRCNAGGIGEHGLASARGRLEARLGRLIDAPPPLAPAERFARHLAREFEAVFLFLRDPSLDATNWRAEHAIRPARAAPRCGGPRRPAAGAAPRRRRSRSSWSPSGRPNRGTNGAGPCATPDRSATTPPSRARPAATPPRGRPRSRNGCIARRNGAASTPPNAASSSATAPPGSGIWPASSSRRHRNRRRLPCQAASVRRGQGPLRPGTDRADAWARQRKDELDAGRLRAIVVELRSHTETTDAARRCLDYVVRNRRRMRCPRFRAQGLCVSSDRVEVGCKQVVGARLKRAGMRWTVDGANAIIAPALLPAQWPLRGLLGATNRQSRLTVLTNLTCTPRRWRA